MREMKQKIAGDQTSLFFYQSSQQFYQKLLTKRQSLSNLNRSLIILDLLKKLIPLLLAERVGASLIHSLTLNLTHIPMFQEDDWDEENWSDEDWDDEDDWDEEDEWDDEDEEWDDDDDLEWNSDEEEEETDDLETDIGISDDDDDWN